eukprot:tig00001415_g8675.t1
MEAFGAPVPIVREGVRVSRNVGYRSTQRCSAPRRAGAASTVGIPVKPAERRRSAFHFHCFSEAPEAHAHSKSERKMLWGGFAFVEADCPLQTRFGIVVEGSAIVEAGPVDALRAKYAGEPLEEEGGDELFLIPGLINAHDHGFGPSAAVLGVRDAELEIWLMGLGRLPFVEPRAAAAYDAALQASSGVTGTVHSHNPRSWEPGAMLEEARGTLRAYAAVGLRVAFHLPMVDQNLFLYEGEDEFIRSLPPHLRPLAESRTRRPPLTTDEYIEVCERLHGECAGEAAHVQAGPAGMAWCSDELVARCAEFARSRRTKYHMHALESRRQRDYARRRLGRPFLEHLEALGCLGPFASFAHMCWAEEGDVAAAGRAGAGDGLREARALWTAHSGALSARDALAAATQGGAAVAFGDDLPAGRLRAGYVADAVLVDLQAALGPWAPPDWLALARPGEGSDVDDDWPLEVALRARAGAAAGPERELVERVRRHLAARDREPPRPCA